MAEETKSFDPKDVVVSWGEIDLDGAAPGAFCNLTYNTAAVVVTMGAQGFASLTKKSDDSGAFTWTASQNAPVNSRLSAIATLQRRSGVAPIKKPLFLRHINGETIAIGPEAVLEIEPGAQFGEEHETREWKWLIPHLQMFVGGSSR